MLLRTFFICAAWAASAFLFHSPPSSLACVCVWFSFPRFPVAVVPLAACYLLTAARHSLSFAAAARPAVRRSSSRPCATFCPRWWWCPPSLPPSVENYCVKCAGVLPLVFESSKQTRVSCRRDDCVHTRLRLPCASCRVADPRCGEIVPCAPVSDSCVRVRDLRARPHRPLLWIIFATHPPPK